MTNLHAHIRDIPDFPKPGIVFKDITPLLRDPAALSGCIDELAELVKDLDVDAVAGVESRGFLFGTPLAMRLGVGFIPIRKPGKLPHETVSQEYALEYGTDTVEMHKDAIQSGQKILVVDDLIATGGTAEAACKLIEQVGGTVSCLAFVVALDFIPWQEKLGNRDVRALLRYA